MSLLPLPYPVGPEAESSIIITFEIDAYTSAQRETSPSSPPPTDSFSASLQSHFPLASRPCPLPTLINTELTLPPTSYNNIYLLSRDMNSHHLSELLGR